jgi:hypothetical protein
MPRKEASFECGEETRRNRDKMVRPEKLPRYKSPANMGGETEFSSSFEKGALIPKKNAAPSAAAKPPFLEIRYS